ncbi:MAG: type II toxin-antitoxin system VapC family toxin [Planctomycetota bacterium]|jgi:hypothetical protein|nr:type II toxin-antitoxin system VapC family toxin [Planctomycetota bacterium]
MAKKRVYVESSVFSWLTANPPNDILKLAKQRQTHMWWERRHTWELFISPVVVREIRDGDPAAARKRLEAANGLPVVPETEDARRLADHLIAVKAVPERYFDDAMHIAIASVQGMDYLATWNQKHLFKAEGIEGVYKAVRQMRHTPAVLVRPDGLLETYHGI